MRCVCRDEEAEALFFLNEDVKAVPLCCHCVGSLSAAGIHARGLGLAEGATPPLGASCVSWLMGTMSASEECNRFRDDVAGRFPEEVVSDDMLPEGALTRLAVALDHPPTDRNRADFLAAFNDQVDLRKTEDSSGILKHDTVPYKD